MGRAAPNAANLASSYVYLLVLPTGQVLFNDGLGNLEVYNATGSARSSWLPVVTTVPGGQPWPTLLRVAPPRRRNSTPASSSSRRTRPML